jgi:RNA 2',3'-cyclic 3'-phosphodiesterase
MIRLFAALAIPPQIGLKLQSRQVGIGSARWRPLEALHVTLRFFGEIREDIARDLDEALLELAVAPFDIALEGVGSFADGDEVSAVWAGVAEHTELKRLAGACEKAARTVGLKPDPRRYRPHVTLAYLRRPDLAQVAAWLEGNARLQSPPFRIDSFQLYSSILSPDGSRYRVEATYPLAAP